MGSPVRSHAITPVALSPADTLDRAGDMMRVLGVSDLPIVEGGRLLCMVSLHDLEDDERDGDAPIGADFAMTPLTVDVQDDLVDAARIMERYDVSCVAVLSRGHFVGALTLPMIVKLALRQDWVAEPVSRLMTRMPLVRVDLHSRLPEARAIMRRAHVSHLPVMDREHFAGLLSERDLTAVCRSSLDSPDMILAGEIMDPRPPTSAPDRSVSEVGRSIVTEHADAVAVVAADRLMGIVTKTDFLTHFVAAASRQPAAVVPASLLFRIAP